MDIISGLSDDLLLKILLFVPTKDAVSTSILSKRWKYLWMWLPKLDYSPRICSVSECHKLRRFLDRTLPLHRAPIIESFRLRVGCSCFKPENINTWILTAVSHCVRELEIVYESDPAEPVVLPSNLYTCKSLVILKLEGGILLDANPAMVSLPSLKTLKFQGLRYLNDETLPLLLSECPVLEDLVLDLRVDDNPSFLIAAVPSLQSFSLSIPYNYHIDGLVVRTNFVLVAPALKYFKLMDYRQHFCLLENMPNLIEAYVDVYVPCMENIIGPLTSVKRLSICSKNMLDEGFVFNQLEHLELCLCMEHSSNQLVRLLKASSNLKKLDISLMPEKRMKKIFQKDHQKLELYQAHGDHKEKVFIIKEGGVEALLVLVQPSQNATILRVASGAITSLEMNERIQYLIMKKGGAQLLAKMVTKTADPQTLRLVTEKFLKLLKRKASRDNSRWRSPET